MKRPRAAVLILNYNGLRSLGNDLFSSIASSLEIDYDGLEVVVIDNGSSDGSDSEIEARFSGDILLIRLGRNYGYAGGNELGLWRYIEKRGLPDYVVIMNNDYIVKNPEILREAIGVLEERASHVIAQGINLTAEGDRVESAGVFLDLMLQQIGRCGGLRPQECPERISYTSSVMGAFMVIKLRPILQVRGHLFKTEHFLLWEETELALNMWSHGYRSLAIPSISGIHLGTRTVGKSMPLAWYLGRRNKYAVYRRTLGSYSKALGAYMPITMEALNCYLRILQGARGAIASRGFIDSFTFREITKVARGPFEPMLIAPRRLSRAFHNLLLASAKSLMERHGYLSRLATLTVDDSLLSRGGRPFLVRV
jgi:GT2 family glycosyltransferase